MKSELERARAQFEYEREHHARILATPKGAKRSKAFSEAYGGLYEGMRAQKFLDQETEPEIKAVQKFRLLKRFLQASSQVAECGPGNFHLAKVVAPNVATLALVDVVNNNPDIKLPKNSTFYESDGVHLPKKLNDLDLVWSAHVVEHIHPDEVHDHLADVRRSLKTGGHYIIFTPNRFSGPHDISRRFSNVAEGLHLKEYTVREMRKALKASGFKKVLCYAGGKGIYVRVPAFWPIGVEIKLSLCPRFTRHFFASLLPIKALLGIIIVGQK
jgi:SAM-dependent methyltransferase